MQSLYKFDKIIGRFMSNPIEEGKELPEEVTGEILEPATDPLLADFRRKRFMAVAGLILSPVALLAACQQPAPRTIPTPDQKPRVSSPNTVSALPKGTELPAFYPEVVGKLYQRVEFTLPKSRNRIFNFDQNLQVSERAFTEMVAYIESISMSNPRLEGNLDTGHVYGIYPTPRNFTDRVIFLSPNSYPAPSWASGHRVSLAQLPDNISINYIPVDPNNPALAEINTAFVEGVCRSGLIIQAAPLIPPPTPINPVELEERARNDACRSIALSFMSRQAGIPYQRYEDEMNRRNTQPAVRYISFSQSDYEAIPVAGLPVMKKG